MYSSNNGLRKPRRVGFLVSRRKMRKSIFDTFALLCEYVQFFELVFWWLIYKHYHDQDPFQMVQIFLRVLNFILLHSRKTGIDLVEVGFLVHFTLLIFDLWRMHDSIPYNLITDVCVGLPVVFCSVDPLNCLFWWYWKYDPFCISSIPYAEKRDKCNQLVFLECRIPIPGTDQELELV